jgi:hypothetical protein
MRPTPLRILSAYPRIFYHYRTPYVSHSVRVSRICATALPFARMMSSSPSKHLFAVYAPDYTDPGVLERRFSVREKHLKGIDGMLDSGIMSTCILLVHMTFPILLPRIWGSPFGTGTY